MRSLVLFRISDFTLEERPPKPRYFDWDFLNKTLQVLPHREWFVKNETFNKWENIAIEIIFYLN